MKRCESFCFWLVESIRICQCQKNGVLQSTLFVTVLNLFVRRFTKNCFCVLYSWFLQSTKQKLEKMNRYGFWPANENAFTRNLFDRSNDFFDLSNHANALKRFFFRNAFKVALSSSIRHVFILSCNFTRIFGNLLVLQKNAFLYFILDLCIQQNRKLEKINRYGFWPTNQIPVPGNLIYRND